MENARIIGVVSPPPPPPTPPPPRAPSDVQSVCQILGLSVQRFNLQNARCILKNLNLIDLH